MDHQSLSLQHEGKDLDFAHVPGTNWGRTQTDPVTYASLILAGLVASTVAVGLVVSFIEGAEKGKRAAVFFFWLGSVFAAAQIFETKWLPLVVVVATIPGVLWWIRRRAQRRER